MQAGAVRALGALLSVTLGWCCLRATGADAQSAAPKPNYQRIAEIALPGSGNSHALSIDAAARRLYVTHADHIDIVDIDRNRIDGSIADTPNVSDFAIAHDLGRGFASDGDLAQLRVIDLKTRAVLAYVTTGTGPDAVVFDPKRNEVYTFNARGNSATVIDARSNRVVTTLVLPGRSASAIADSDSGRIYVSIVDKNLVLTIDEQTHAIVGLWQISPGMGPTSLTLDPVHHRLFIGCRNHRLLMVDAQNGRVIAALAIGSIVDASAFDPREQWVLGGSGEGSLTIASAASPEHLSLIQTVSTQSGARGLAFDPVTRNVYLVVADAAGAADAPPEKALPITPGALKVLVFAPAHR